MSQALPYNGFKWLSSTDIERLNVANIPIDAEYGYILEVDLDYPYNIHDHHNDLPFCPTIKLPTKTAKVEKLVADLGNKRNYVIHYRTLQQCLSNGLQLKKIHRGLCFKQKAWLKTYIDLNTLHRTNAKNSFEKDFFKLLNNAVYGKTMENVEKKVDVRLVTEWDPPQTLTTGRKRLCARALIAKTNFHSSTKINDNFYAIQMKRLRNLLNKPMYLGFSVLDLSKWKMYDFHYSYMKPKFKENITLNYMDTDSFIYTIKTEDFYSDIRADVDEKFDTSDYSDEATILYNFKKVNKKKLGFFKDELNGKPMSEFVGLRPKMYCYKIDSVEKTFKKNKRCEKDGFRKDRP